MNISKNWVGAAPESVSGVKDIKDTAFHYIKHPIATDLSPAPTQVFEIFNK